eukprot:4633298-Pleurochrysis_carterae.AAC.1
MLCCNDRHNTTRSNEEATAKAEGDERQDGAGKVPEKVKKGEVTAKLMPVRVQHPALLLICALSKRAGTDECGLPAARLSSRHLPTPRRRCLCTAARAARPSAAVAAVAAVRTAKRRPLLHPTRRSAAASPGTPKQKQRRDSKRVPLRCVKRRVELA